MWTKLSLGACVLFTLFTMYFPAQADDNILGLPEKAIARSGKLVVAGGGHVPDEIYDEFVRLAGGERARIVLIPSAYPYSSAQHIRNRFAGWRGYNVRSFELLHTDDPDTANDDAFVKPLASATGVWIAGGAQGRLTYRYGKSKVEAAVRGVLERGGVVGGTSAGAAVLSQVMIRDGSPAEAVVDDGFGLMSRAVIDQHFSQRGRHTRLLGVLDEHPEMIGLGVDEGTALIVEGNHLRVIGASRVTICLSRTTEDAMALYRLGPNERADLIELRAARKGPTVVMLHRYLVKK
jgi:cyanophycinase